MGLDLLEDVFLGDEKKTVYSYVENEYTATRQAKFIPWTWTGEQSYLTGPVKQALCPSDPAVTELGMPEVPWFCGHLLLPPTKRSTVNHWRVS